ncbi:hypothetical protein [Erwinia persicina]|uniref:hypothetical protein n=1 Tax=Erwinia persicina TaxID=55211 RepID=UPI0039B0B915
MLLHELRLALFISTQKIILHRILTRLPGRDCSASIARRQAARNSCGQFEPEEPEVVTTLRQTCKKLSARKQQQIAEFIQVIAGPQKRTAKA